MIDLEFDAIEDDLISADLEVGAAELHGTLVGLMIGAPNNALELWFEQIFGPKDVPPEWAKGLADWTGETLADPDFGFQLLLPDDEKHDIFARTNAISDWAQGLLYGLGLAEIDDLPKQPEQIREVLTDLTQITQIDEDELENSDTNEEALLEIAEYLRTAVFVLKDHFLAEQGIADDKGVVLH